MLPVTWRILEWNLILCKLLERMVLELQLMFSVYAFQAVLVLEGFTNSLLTTVRKIKVKT